MALKVRHDLTDWAERERDTWAGRQTVNVLMLHLRGVENIEICILLL